MPEATPILGRPNPTVEQHSLAEGGRSFGQGTGCAIRFARPGDVDTLPAIESEAASRFAGLPMAEGVRADGTPVAQLRRAQREGRLWVAEADEGVVGFALVELLDGAAHLDELDVLTSHGRRGIGTALVRTVCAWAGARGLPAVTLTTFRDVPWNAPFYGRLGFRTLAPAELGPELAALVRREHEEGLRSEERVAMRIPA